MRKLTLIVVVALFVSCSNKKAEIVELIKKTKNEWYLAETNRGAYSSAANRLMSYEMTIEHIKKFGKSKQAEDDMQMYKEAYEKAIKELKGEPEEILKDQKKLSAISYKWAFKADDLQRKIDSLELELKKY